MRFIQSKAEHGFSLPELMISILIFLPVAAATFSLFSVSMGEHNSEQSSAETTQEARSALEMMTEEISQAGTQRDFSTTTSAPVAGSSTSAQSIVLASASGFADGDYVEIGLDGDNELSKITAVGTNSITGIFRYDHASGIPVRLYPYPYLASVIKPAGLAANSSTTATTLRFFGDINSDGTVNYVVYSYSVANAQIMRSSTPITQANPNDPTPLISNIKAGSPQFTLYTDSLGIVTTVEVSFVVTSPWKTGSQYQETPLSSRILIPSAARASVLLAEYNKYGGVYQFPSTPSHVTTWASQ
jgi:prepilin-type N-terminal cleavage/methylation domain-containing protein